MIDLKELEALARAATMGPWEVQIDERPHFRGGNHLERRIRTTWEHGQLRAPYPVITTSTGIGETAGGPAHHMVGISEPDAAFIAAANPAAVLELIALAIVPVSPAMVGDSQLRRFDFVDPDEGSATMDEQPDGWWVTYDEALAHTAAAVAAERERAARLALQWSNARNPDNGGHALRNYAQALRDGIDVSERDSDYHWSKAPAVRVGATLSDEQIKAIAQAVGMSVSHDGKYMRSVGTHGGLNVEDGITFARAILASHAESVPLAAVKDHVLREVVNSLRDTAIGFHDTQQLRERLRSCLTPLLAQRAASVVAPQEQFLYYGLSSEQLQQLLDGGLKPEEISGADDVQHDRVHELVWWFARLMQGNANAKWAVRHACELAYFIATNGINRHIDLKATRDAAFKEGVNITPAERGMLERIGFATPQPAPAAVLHIERDAALDKFLKALEQIDFHQFAMHRNPCWRIDEEGRFCGRDKSWAGHQSGWKYVSLKDAIAAMAAQQDEKGGAA